jgi:hypothetical protein
MAQPLAWHHGWVEGTPRGTKARGKGALIHAKAHKTPANGLRGMKAWSASATGMHVQCRQKLQVWPKSKDVIPAACAPDGRHSDWMACLLSPHNRHGSCRRHRRHRPPAAAATRGARPRASTYSGGRLLRPHVPETDAARRRPLLLHCRHRCRRRRPCTRRLCARLCQQEV